MNKRINFNSPVFKILLMFLTWRLALVIVFIFAIYFVPLGYKDRFLGGGPINYGISPQLFSWANFDGEHYLSIAIFGYKNLEQAFFPVYPALISFFAKPDPFNLLSSLVYSTLTGLIISNVSFILALIFLFELIRIDFSKKIAYLTILLILIFPTSFYFGSIYNESFFLLLSVLSFYFARKGNWLFAGIFGAVASATRVFGILLFPALLIEAWTQKTKSPYLIWTFLIPLGLLAYMLYLYLTVGDPIAFYSFQKLVGEQHQSGIITLPQVYFRYLKMLLTTSTQNPIFQTVLLELVVGLSFFILPIYGYFKKIRLSYILFAFFGFLIPTVQGSFSSTPRYVIVLFPSFLAAALWFSQLPKLIKALLIFTSISAFVLESALFLRGYWIA